VSRTLPIQAVRALKTIVIAAAHALMNRFFYQALERGPSLARHAFQSMRRLPAYQHGVRNDAYSEWRDISGATSCNAQVATVPLEYLAWGRSGLKSTYVNVSLVARKIDFRPFIDLALSTDVVHDAITPYLVGDVERIDRPDLHGFQFRLHFCKTTIRPSEREAKHIARIVLGIHASLPSQIFKREGFVQIC
jgi:hypothetical protein